MADGVELRLKSPFTKIRDFLRKAQEQRYLAALNRCGEIGVQLLAANTPKRTGLTAASWNYSIEGGNGNYRIQFNNTNDNGGRTNVALLIQMGHGTGTGGYVAGVDYINPVLGPIAEYLGDQVAVEINKL